MASTLERLSAGDGSARTLARGLGWFSLARGAAELLAPGPLSEAAGVGGRRGLVQACGLRDLAAGTGILASSDQRPWIWSRIAGDAIDLATLAPGLTRRNPHRRATWGAFGAVGGAEAVS